MRRFYPFVVVLMTCVSNAGGQEVNHFKEKFLQELNSGDLEDGCTIVIHVTNAAANAACFVPEPTVSKVACAAAKVLNVAQISTLDPNSPNLIVEAGIRVCQITYAATKTGITYTFEFTENQSKEISETWQWLNTLDGGIQFLNYLSP